MQTEKDRYAGVYEQIPTSHYLTGSRGGTYYTGDYKIGLNFYSLSHNLSSWLSNSTEGAPPLDTLKAIRLAKKAGFDSVDVTAYYIPGYHNTAMPAVPDETIFAYARSIKELCAEIGIAVSGTGIKNDFADPSAERRKLDIQRAKYWIDVAAAMGAPVIRLFTGEIPGDLLNSTWEAIAQERIVPALRECAEYGALQGVKIGMQNHGDMASTADQVVRILQWADHPNIGVVNDTGCYKTFGDRTGIGYSWYDDIEAVLPYTINFQVKKKPTAPDTDITVDLDELFTRIRHSNYRGYIPLETLWTNQDADHPNTLPEPPFAQIREFLDQVRAAAERTKTRYAK
ncbi:sugar phosphate isomerase/epimerase family protein [Paenibacillus thalictri]|nr:sugar phosphate isomerase/epimerase family protein [Paenibacillus thalictri]